MKKTFTYILLAILMLAPMSVSAKTIYFQPNIWNLGSEKFGVYYFGGASAAHYGNFLTNIVEGTGSTAIYDVTIPDDATTVIFIRYTTSATSPGWSNVDKQTIDLTIGNNNLFKVTAWDESDANRKSIGTWGTFTIAATGVTLEPTTAEVEVGKTINLTATILPANATDKTITWTSDAETIATVANGVVTGVAEGTATITATTHNGLTATCTVTVKPAAGIAVTSITVAPATLTLTEGDESAALGVTVLPEDAADKSYTWESSDEAVATVADGVVTAVAKGTAKITATANDGSGKVGTCVVTVEEKLYSFRVKFRNTYGTATVQIYAWGTGVPSEMSVWPGVDMNIDEDGWHYWDFTDARPSFILNYNGTNKTIDIVDRIADCCIELSDKENYLYTVKDIDCSPQYYLVGYWSGTTYEGTDYPFVNGECHVTLPTDANICVKSNLGKVYTVEKYADWTSSMAISAPLYETTKSVGSATKPLVKGGMELTFKFSKTDDGWNLYYERPLIPVTSIALNHTALELNPDGTSTLEVAFTPADADNKNITWSVSPEGIVTVDKGAVTAVAVGEATITATAYGGATATCAVTVTELNIPSEAVTISQTSASLKPNETLELTASADGTNTAVIWSSSASGIATVEDGLVTAVAAGEAIITATAADGSGVFANCTITVKEPQYLYLNTGGSILWDNMSPRYAAYFYDNTAGKNEWVSMTQITATPNVYTVEAPIDHNYSAVIFVRMNPGNTENRWNNDSDGDNDNKPVWDQTGDLTFSETENFYHITSWGYNNRATGYWTTYTDGATGEQATAQYNESAVQKNDPRVMLQACYWESFADTARYGRSNWSLLNAQADVLGTTFDLIWLPPSAKSADRHGYLPIDYSDQNSKYWGTATELKTLITNLKAGGAEVVADIVMNHIAGDGDWCTLHSQNFGKYGFYTPTMDWICSSDEVNRGSWKMNDDGETYHDGMVADKCEYCENSAKGAEDTGMDIDDLYSEKNYDAARDWDHTNPVVQSMMISYLKWLQTEIGYAGWRYDFGKGVDGKYIEQYNRASETNFSVMEYFDGNTETLINYLITTNHNTMVFDFGMKFQIFNDAIQYGDYNKMQGKGLIAAVSADGTIPYKRHAVTFIDSHDTFYRPDGNNPEFEFMEYGNSMKAENKDKVLLANAYLLSMPGVPCVAYPHWYAYSKELIPMIQARKDAGVHSESTVVDEVGTDFYTNNFYKATITGANGSIRLLLGPHSGYETCPEGYTLVANGTNYGMYAQVNGNVDAQSIAFDTEAVTLIPGDTKTLTATLFPAYATSTVTWSTGNEAVAMVADGVITAVAKGTTTITATANGHTATCTVTVAETNTVPIYFEVSGTGWGTNIVAHAYCDTYIRDIEATKLDIAHATKTWYKAEIPVVTGQQVNVQARNGEGNEFADYSAAIENFTTESAYVINSTVDSEGHRTVTSSDELSLTRKFLYVTTRDGQAHYSNRITTADGVLSCYVQTDGNKLFYYGNDIAGYQQKFCANVTTDGIYYATVTDKNIGTLQLYTGSYYIRSAVAEAGWDGDYKAANKMEKIADYDATTDVDQYYWLDFIDPTKVGNKNAKAAVANEYNDYLAEVDDYWITGDGDSPTGGANVRYGWNPTTNAFTRDMMGGSTTSDFLTLYATEANKIFKADANGKPTVSCHDGGKEVIYFRDATDYMYSAEVYAVEGAMGVMKARFAGTDDFLFKGLTDNAKPLLAKGFEGADKTTYKHRMKVYYDFKTKRISSAWMPTEHIGESQEIDRKLCISRTGAGDATTFTMDEEAVLTVKDLEVELFITKEECEANGGFFWFSLPFTCKISEISGLPQDHYGDGKWVIQRYRGDLRSGGIGTLTYWRNVNKTATLEANRGYVLYINVDDTNINWEFEYITVFFHPAEDQVQIHGSANVTVNEYIHKTEPAESNWSLIGPGSLQDMKASRWTTESTSRYAIQNSFYTWRWEDGKGVYSLANAEFTPMTPTQSYFVQYAGTINMLPHTTVTQSLAPRRAPEQNDIYFMQMEVSNGAQSDKTYIILDETATAAYDLNLDLGKIVNQGMPQVYTMCAASKLAANNLPAVENQTIYVGVIANKAGDYTFSLPRISEGVTPVLYDSETGSVTNLALDDYTVALEAGTYETRFSLRLNKPGVATECEQPIANGSWQITQVGSELLISGIAGEADIRLYDALGRQLYHTTHANELIPVEQTGVYLLSVNGETQRILVK